MFGDRLRELRKDKKISQEEIGNLCDVAKNTVSNWENNINQPSFEIVTKLADYFNVTTDYLLVYNQDDINRIKRLKSALKENGINDVEKAMQIIEILKEQKDTNK